MIAIIDYGMGNIHSVQKALESMDAGTFVTNDPERLAKTDKAVLPGVGAFDDAMSELNARGLSDAIRDFAAAGKPLLGICLGMQLFLEESEEAETEKGLGLVKGKVRLFPRKPGFKVPQMGWNRLKIVARDCPLFKGTAEEPFVYFCHSYYVEPADKSYTAASTDYSADFTSVLWKKNLYGVQFHPEKSQEAGMRILRNFVSL